jgi:hypothetical protein
LALTSRSTESRRRNDINVDTELREEMIQAICDGIDPSATYMDTRQVAERVLAELDKHLKELVDQNYRKGRLSAADEIMIAAVSGSYPGPAYYKARRIAQDAKEGR